MQQIRPPTQKARTAPRRWRDGGVSLETRGYYRLNPDKLQQYGQLTIDFDGTEILLQEEKEEEQPSVENQDMSLDLFAGEY